MGHATSNVCSTSVVVVEVVLVWVGFLHAPSEHTLVPAASAMHSFG